MYLEHFGLGFAGKRIAPAVSLGTLFLTVQWADRAAAVRRAHGRVDGTGLAMWLFVPWGWWIDRHRTIVPAG
jgi:hypothetical protein